MFSLSSIIDSIIKKEPLSRNSGVTIKDSNSERDSFLRKDSFLGINPLSVKSISIKKVLICILAFCGITMFMAHSTQCFDLTTERLKSKKKISPLSGEIVEQQITGFEEKPLYAINIRSDTNGFGKEGTVYIGLYEDGEEIDSWTLPFFVFEEDSYKTLELKNLLRMKKDSLYSLRIEEEYEGEEMIVLCANTETGENHLLDGTEHSGTICYTMTYRNTGLRTHFVVIGSLLGILVTALILLEINETMLMAVVLGILMLVFMQICRPFMAPDEEDHFNRAFEVAEIGLVSEHIGETGVGGNRLPSAISEYVGLYVEKKKEETVSAAEGLEESEELEPSEEVLLPSPASLPVKDAEKEELKKKLLLNWDETEEVAYGNTALYSPVNYLPMSAGIKLAGIVSNNVPTLYYAGRWGNAIACFLLCVLALCTIPFGKRILFLIMTFPITIQEMVTLTADGFTLSVCFFFLALVLRLSYEKRKVNPANMAVLGITSVILAQLKIVYVVLLILIFMIPDGNFSSKRISRLFKCGAAGLALLLNLLWLRTSSGYLVEFNPGVDSPAQFLYVMTHIPTYYMVCARTFVKGFGNWIPLMISNPMGALKISTTPIIWTSALILLVYEICTCREVRSDVHKWDPLLLILTFLSGCMLILSSLYVQWTAYRNSVIIGVQGRYFTPILGTLAFFVVFMQQRLRRQKGFIPAEDAMRIKGSYCYLIVLFYNSITVLDIAKFFIKELW